VFPVAPITVIMFFSLSSKLLQFIQYGPRHRGLL
jgi:hypothetical protein